MNNVTCVNAMIVAGGKGARMHADISKQYLKLQGEYIISLTLKTFEECPLIRDIVVVVAEDCRHFFEHDIAPAFPKIKKVVTGGVTRQESVWFGLESMPSDTKMVLIHDAVRPFVESSHIRHIIEETHTHKSCTLGVKVVDTIKIVKDDLAVETPDREHIYAIQTPQAFDYQAIVAAHKKARLDGYTGSDDSVLLDRIGIPTKIVEGSYRNIKITTPEDLRYGEVLLGSVLSGSKSN